MAILLWVKNAKKAKCDIEAHKKCSNESNNCYAYSKQKVLKIVIPLVSGTYMRQIIIMVGQIHGSLLLWKIAVKKVHK